MLIRVVVRRSWNHAGLRWLDLPNSWRRQNREESSVQRNGAGRFILTLAMNLQVQSGLVALVGCWLHRMVHLSKLFLINSQTNKPSLWGVRQRKQLSSKQSCLHLLLHLNFGRLQYSVALPYSSLTTMALETLLYLAVLDLQLQTFYLKFCYKLSRALRSFLGLREFRPRRILLMVCRGATLVTWKNGGFMQFLLAIG